MPAALMSAWQATISSTRKAAMKAVPIPSDGRHQGDIGPKRATGGSMRACTRDRGRQMQTASESRNEGDGRGAPGHGTGRHPSKEAPPEGNASATRAAALGRRMRRPAPTATSPANGLSSASPGIDLARLGSAPTNCHQTDLHLLRRDRAMNKPGWVQKHWYDLRLAHQKPKAGARSRQTVVRVLSR